MIRKLHAGLGIPVEVLLQEPGAEDVPDLVYDPRDYPFTELFNKGFLPGVPAGAPAGTPATLKEAKQRAEQLLRDLLAVLGQAPPQPVLCRRSARQPDLYALQAWQARVLGLAREWEEKYTLPDYNPDYLTEDALRALAQQSRFSAGPENAREQLHQWGIHLVVLEHLDHTYLDGAAFIAPWGRPVVGLTLRHDRLDNFWFTLMHELAHVKLHLGDNGLAFFDDTDSPRSADEAPREAEANAFAQRILIPSEVWEQEKARLLDAIDEAGVLSLADRLQVSPAIVAGQLRYAGNNTRIHGSLVGRNLVREKFPEYKLTPPATE